MKKSIQFLLFVLFIAALTTQCDVIDQPFKNGGPQDTTSTAQLRNVLIEDFTGHRCKNCPKASKKIKELVNAFGANRIIGLAIHAGPGIFTGTNADYPTDFTTLEGKQIQNFFGTNMLPVGMINRENWTSSGNSHWSTFDEWPTLSAEAMDSTLRVELEVEASVDFSDTTIAVNVKAIPQVAILHDLDVVVMVKESGIVSPQLLEDDTRDPNYVHDNVLREFITPTWGEEIGNSPMLPGDEYLSSHSMSWNTSWVRTNSAVVVYVYNPTNYRILQVVEASID